MQQVETFRVWLLPDEDLYFSRVLFWRLFFTSSRGNRKWEWVSWALVEPLIWEVWAWLCKDWLTQKSDEVNYNCLYARLPCIPSEPPFLTRSVSLANSLGMQRQRRWKHTTAHDNMMSELTEYTVYWTGVGIHSLRHIRSPSSHPEYSSSSGSSWRGWTVPTSFVRFWKHFFLLSLETDWVVQDEGPGTEVSVNKSRFLEVHDGTSPAT